MREPPKCRSFLRHCKPVAAAEKHCRESVVLTSLMMIYEVQFDMEATYTFTRMVSRCSLRQLSLVTQCGIFFLKKCSICAKGTSMYYVSTKGGGRVNISSLSPKLVLTQPHIVENRRITMVPLFLRFIS